MDKPLTNMLGVAQQKKKTLTYNNIAGALSVETTF